MFLRNQWYVAAWSHEVGRALLSRRIAGEPIVLYRTEGGRAVAFADRCPHRLAPLSRGRLVGDALECGYHGIAFADDGRCIRIPGQEAIPKDARARAIGSRSAGAGCGFGSARPRRPMAISSPISTG